MAVGRGRAWLVLGLAWRLVEGTAVGRVIDGSADRAMGCVGDAADDDAVDQAPGNAEDQPRSAPATNGHAEAADSDSAATNGSAHHPDPAVVAARGEADPR